MWTIEQIENLLEMIHVRIHMSLRQEFEPNPDVDRIINQAFEDYRCVLNASAVEVKEQKKIRRKHLTLIQGGKN